MAAANNSPSASSDSAISTLQASSPGQQSTAVSQQPPLPPPRLLTSRDRLRGLLPTTSDALQQISDTPPTSTSTPNDTSSSSASHVHPIPAQQTNVQQSSLEPAIDLDEVNHRIVGRRAVSESEGSQQMRNQINRTRRASDTESGHPCGSPSSSPEVPALVAIRGLLTCPSRRPVSSSRPRPRPPPLSSAQSAASSSGPRHAKASPNLRRSSISSPQSPSSSPPLSRSAFAPYPPRDYSRSRSNSMVNQSSPLATEPVISPFSSPLDIPHLSLEDSPATSPAAGQFTNGDTAMEDMDVQLEEDVSQESHSLGNISNSGLCAIPAADEEEEEEDVVLADVGDHADVSSPLSSTSISNLSLEHQMDMSIPFPSTTPSFVPVQIGPTSAAEIPSSNNVPHSPAPLRLPLRHSESSDHVSQPVPSTNVGLTIADVFKQQASQGMWYAAVEPHRITRVKNSLAALPWSTVPAQLLPLAPSAQNLPTVTPSSPPPSCPSSSSLQPVIRSHDSSTTLAPAISLPSSSGTTLQSASSPAILSTPSPSHHRHDPIENLTSSDPRKSKGKGKKSREKTRETVVTLESGLN
ncbi:hypothetical protein JCM3765_003454 [Sporobolomyces pararoseus]